MKQRRVKRLLITAGPTREMLDPVRFLSNLSTGEMGYTLARIAHKQKYQVTLISGPAALKPPRGVRFFSITSAADLQRACRRLFPKHDALIMTAAVCDFTAAKKNSQKIRRTHTRSFLLKQTPDILAGLGRRKGKRTLIGFCLETEDWLKNAQNKLVRKHLDGIVANYYTKSHVPFGNRKITTAFLEPGGKTRFLYHQSKPRIAAGLLKWMEGLGKRAEVKKHFKTRENSL